MKTQPVGLPSEAGQSERPTQAGDVRVLGFAVLSFVAVCFVVFTVATQWLAYRFNYQQALGEPLFGRIYSPLSWLVWSHKYYDNATPDFNRVYLGVIVALGLLFLGYAVWFTIRGRRFVLIDRQGRVAASEYEGGHMRTAWQFLTGYKPAAAWKTAAILAALRQAIREEHAACRTEYLDELFDRNPTRDHVRAWMREARERDVDHHGTNTF